MEKLRITCLSLNASADLAANTQAISAGIQAAAKAGAQILLTPECALAGYPGACRDDFSDINWCEFDNYEDLLHTRAQAAGIALVLGTLSNQKGAIYNDSLFCGHDATVTRYHKRCLTPFDRSFFSAGQTPCTTQYLGWQIGLTVCYDVRFAHTWGDVVAAGADLVLNIAHMAGPDPDPGVKSQIIPQHYASRAAEWATPIVMCNTTHPKRWLNHAAWDARGVISAGSSTTTLSLFEVQKRSAFNQWYSDIHADALHHYQLNQQAKK